MAVMLKAEDVWEGIGQALAGPLPSRQGLWQMAHAFRMVDGELVRALDVNPGSPEQARRAGRALIELREALNWIDQHRSGVLRFEIAAVLRRAHHSVGEVLTILEETHGGRRAS